MKKLLIITVMLSSAMAYSMMNKQAAAKFVNSIVERDVDLVQAAAARYKALKAQAEAYSALRSEMDMLEKSTETNASKIEAYVDIDRRLEDLSAALRKRAQDLKKSFIKLNKDEKAQAIADLQTAVERLKAQHGGILKKIHEEGAKKEFVIGMSRNTETQNARDTAFQAIGIRAEDPKKGLTYFELLGIREGDSPAIIQEKANKTLKAGLAKLQDLPKEARNKAVSEYKNLVSLAVEELTGQD